MYLCVYVCMSIYMCMRDFRKGVEEQEMKR